MDPRIPVDTLLDAARRFGSPVFVYDAASITQRIQLLKGAFDVPAFDIRYACKAQSTLAILELIRRQGCGMDTVSPGEIRLALQAGVPPESISFTPSGVRKSEYDEAIRQGVRIHVDQMSVLAWLDQHHPGTSVTLRMNPGIRAGGHEKLQVGSAGSKFGFPATQLDEVVAFIRGSTLRVAGIHMHLGSDIRHISEFGEALDFLLGVAGIWGDQISHVDIGGGYSVPYHPGEAEFDIRAFGREVSRRFRSFCEAIGRSVTLTIEPGKYIVSQAGYLLMEVTGVREAHPADLVYVQSGFNHFVRPMNYGAYHHLLNLTNPNGVDRHYDVVGYLCETDTFATQRPLPEVREGDILCLCNAGAYGYTMASQYNMRPRPAEVLWQEEELSLIRRAETFEDLMRTDVRGDASLSV